MRINPLWWVNIRVAGSPRMLLYMALGYVAVVAVFGTITYRMTASYDPGAFYSVWLMIISGAQALFMLLLIPGAINKTVQRDYQNGMIESHRVTPMSNLKIVLGYLIGPSSQALVLIGTGLVCGSFFAAKTAVQTGLGIATTAKVFVGGWFFAQLLVAILALMLASVTLLSAVAVRGGKFNILGIMIFVGVMGGGAALVFVPGLSLLTGVMSITVIVSTITRGVAVGDQTTLVTATLLQIGFAITFLTAAAKKLRAPDRPLFTLALSLALLGLWGLTLVLGIAQQAVPDWMEQEFSDIHVTHLGFSLIAFWAVSLFALQAAAAGRLRLDRAAAYMPAGKRGAALLRSLMPVIAAALSMAVLGSMVFSIERESLSEQLKFITGEWTLWVAVGLAALLGAWVDYNLFYVAAVARMRVWVVLLLNWGLLRIALPLLDTMLLNIVGEMSSEPWGWYGYLTGCSPIGTLFLMMEPCYQLGYGLGVQLAIGLLVAWWARMVGPGRGMANGE